MGSGRAETSTRLLYLYVDVVLALGDDLDVGIVDGLLVVLDARRPVRRRAQHLANADMRGVEEVSELQRAASCTRLVRYYCKHAGALPH